MQVEIFPLMSVAVYDTSVIPTGKDPPGSRVLVSVTALQASHAVGADQYVSDHSEISNDRLETNLVVRTRPELRLILNEL